MSNFIRKFIYLIITAVVGFIYFYISLPAINFHSKDFFSYVVFLCIVYIALTLFGKFFKTKVEVKQTLRENLKQLWNNCRIPTLLIALLLVVSVIGGISSAEFLRAKSYSKLITVNTGDFATDVKEISFDKIPYLDKDSAERLGDRKIGELADMVSQFEVSDDYAQINYKDKPVRVTPLEYGDIIKWFNNRKNGIPAYIVIDMATQAVDFVRLSEPIKYSESELFGRNILRHIRFNYPTFMFAEPVFELDEEGVPYWVCPKIEMKVGLFGGADINGAVLVNAITGESTYEKEVPTWVDRVYSADLIISQYDYYGTYKNGFLNSIFGQKDVTVTTDGYNYIALNDDVYMYTGITSVGGDQSNIGFILSNQRTKETKFYPCAGAAERSAQSSAQGVVQHLGYKATFPLLLNISDQPTYFMALKDKAELVKMYALVNVEQYQIVATGTTVAACEKEYIRLMTENNITVPQKPVETNLKGTITDSRTAVIDGNSTYYIKLDNSENYYYITASENVDVVTLNVGDFVSVDYYETSREKIVKAYNITK